MTSDSLILAIAILGSSFWGSWHCAAMCGPVSSLMATKGALFSYHLGRGISYISLGALGGYLGTLFLNSEVETIRIVSGILFSIILIIMGIQSYRGKSHLKNSLFNRVHTYFTTTSSGTMLGLLTVFLPCGWLYTFVFAAVATKSAYSGALVMGFFWLGGLPALSTLSLFVKRSIQMSPNRKQKISGVILVLSGIYSVVSFYWIQALAK